METEHFKATAILSKKRYQEIEKLAEKYCVEKENVEKFMKEFCDIMYFDPNKKKYKPSDSIYTKRYREKIKNNT